MSHLFAEIPISLEADKDLNALVPQFQGLVEHTTFHIVELEAILSGCRDSTRQNYAAFA